MRILQRYLTARFFGLFASILIGSILTISMAEVLLNFDNALKAQEGIRGLIHYLFLRIPSYYLRDLIPIAAFAATFSALALASRWREVMAIKAGGIPPRRVVIPLLLAGGLLATVSFFFAETAVLRATREWNRRSLEGADPITFRWGSFWYHRANTIYNIKEASRTDQTLRGVKIWEVDERGRLVRSIQADRVKIQPGGEWLFSNARIHRFDPTQITHPPLFERIPGQRVIELADTTNESLMNADVAALPLHALYEHLEARRREGDPSPQLETVLQSRLTDPFAVVIFILLAIPLGLRVEQTNSVGPPALRGIATVAVFFLLRNASSTLSAEGILPAGVLPWTVIAVFLAWGAWRFYRIPT